MNEIIQKENKVLRQIAEDVSVEAIKSRKIKTIIRRMQKALNNEEDGVAIAAPQIGESLRIFIVSERIFEIMAEEQKKKYKKTTITSKRESIDQFEKETELAKELQDMIFINPVILKISKKKATMEEGCLSVRWLYGKVERSEKALVKAFDQNGKLFRHQESI